MIKFPIEPNPPEVEEDLYKMLQKIEEENKPLNPYFSETCDDNLTRMNKWREERIKEGKYNSHWLGIYQYKIRK